MIFSKIKIGIINMNCNNLYSIFNSCQNIGYKTSIIKSSKNLKAFDVIILPGVGSFRQAIKHLKINNFDKEILNFLQLKNKGVLGICLGMQLFFESSEEFGFTKGLGILEGKVKKFEINIDRVPHIGWNKIKFKKQNKIFDKDLNNKNFYFVHSYYCKPNNKKSILSSTKYNDVDFCSSILEKNILATQFHPEKSGKYGLKILENFCKI